ncbi:MAG: ribosome-associated translation inhibitor RaiA [Atopobiaceae bacterium]|nr:ribosome-associated translation inhibitor RaiA [Atopobiaceae bacterium]
MVDIKVSGRKMTVTDSMREHVNEKIGNALKVFDITPMSCDVVLRAEKGRANPESALVEVTVFARDNVVRVVTSDADIFAAVDKASDKVSRQLRKYKTKIVDRRQRESVKTPPQSSSADLASLLVEDDSDELVREKVIEFTPMSQLEALAAIDLLGHDFFVFTNIEDDEVNVLYRRNDGGYGLIKPKTEEEDDD